jgi:translation initiation factor 2 alpha subunit (eIF-2alpha)
MKNIHNKDLKKPKKIRNIIEILIKRWNIQLDRQQEYNKIWKELAGENIGLHTAFERISNSKLHILVENSVWMNELTFLKQQITMTAIQAFLKYDLKINEIVFKIGEIQKKPGASLHVPPPGK